jgi:2,4-dienoyl-CoA reductase-like NADH-dependent reductase (Old Yellow Enzyme family)/thioredoxin reductase
LVHSHEEYGEIIMCELTMYDYNSIAMWKELVDAIHFWGTKVFVQINYTGAGFNPLGTTGVQAVTPSEITLANGAQTRAATLDDVRNLVDRYGNAAQIAKLAGFDGINLHCAHGYGISSWQSPFLNHRTDEYGGSFDNRMKFGLEVLQRVKETVGNDLAVICRMPVDEWVPEGIHAEDSVKIAKKYAEAGADAIDLSSGTSGSAYAYKGIQSRFLRRGFLEPYLDKFRKEIDVPIIVAGSFNDPLDAERVLMEGKADFIAIARPLLADPEYPNKVIEGKLDDIRKCRRCMDGCIHSLLVNLPTDCAVNVEVGRERALQVIKTMKPKKVLVIGGGPGGMEAARVAALRGHKVTLYEKSTKLGGNMLPSSTPSFKEEEKWLINWFAKQLSQVGVKVVFNKEVSAAKFRNSWDTVVVATGAVPIIPDIPGVEKAITAVDVLLGKAKAGEKPVIIGGAEVGCETALFLAENGKKCTILEMRDDLAPDVSFIFVKPALMEKLTEFNIKWFIGMKVVEITNDGAVCVDRNGQKKTFEGDTVILAVGLKPVDSLVEELRGKTKEIYPIGDCVKPRKVYQAIHEASLIARRI